MSYVGYKVLTGNKNKILGIVIQQNGDTIAIHARESSVFASMEMSANDMLNQGRLVEDFSDPTFKPSNKRI